MHVEPPGPKPLIVKTAGVPSLAGFGEASGVPPSVQMTEMLTDPFGSSGSKSFVTVKVTEAGALRVLMIVQVEGLPPVIATSRQPRSLLV